MPSFRAIRLLPVILPLFVSCFVLAQAPTKLEANRDTLFESVWGIALTRLPDQDLHILGRVFRVANCETFPELPQTQDAKTVASGIHSAFVDIRRTSLGCLTAMQLLSREDIQIGCIGLNISEGGDYAEGDVRETQSAIRQLGSKNPSIRRCALANLINYVALAHSWPLRSMRGGSTTISNSASLISEAQDTDTPSEAWDVDPIDWADEDSSSRELDSPALRSPIRMTSTRRIKLGGIRLAYLIHYSMAR